MLSMYLTTTVNFLDADNPNISGGMDSIEVYIKTIYDES